MKDPRDLKDFADTQVMLFGGRTVLHEGSQFYDTNSNVFAVHTRPPTTVALLIAS